MECGYASTRRAQCTVCAKPIALKSLQLGVEVDDPDWGKVTRWSHPACTKLTSIADLQADLQGFGELDPADQETLRSLVKASAPRPKESVSIDRRAIPSLALDSQFSGDALESLKQLGVEIYTEGDLERGIIEQAQDQLAEKGRPQERAASAASTVSAASAATVASAASAEGGSSSSAAAKPAQSSASSGGTEPELAPAMPSTQHEAARGSGSGSSAVGSGGGAPRAAAAKRKAPSPSTVDGGAAPAPATAAPATAAAAAAAAAATVRAPKARRTQDCDGDEALARVLSSQRSERVSVARQRVHKPWEGADSESDDGAAEEGEGEEVKHEVARVVKERQRGGRLEYRVKWSMGDSTWEPLEHVEGLEALAEYRARKASGDGEHRPGKAAGARPAGDAPRRGGAGSDDEEWHAEEDQYEDEDEDEGEEEDEGELEEELEDDELEELEEGELEEGELRQPRGGAAAAASRGDGGASGGRGRRGGGKRRRQSTAETSPYGESDEELEDELLDDGLRMPGRLWKHLFTHQRTCIEWLWELHRQEAGGVVGDEMGLGKTLQVVGIWAALHHSGRGGPCIVVSPATVMRQWVRELRRWAPEIETQLLHNSTGASDPATRSKLVRGVVRAGEGGACAVLVTSYEAVRQQAGLLLQQQWQYVVLDEGHKIRNPDAAITQVCKRFNTGHRLILSGSPIQNKLTELWSLFDFVFPGKLGTLPTFQEQFGLPIAAGTYANASRFKVQAAYQCSLVLRSLIRPHLLRRLKADVDIALPDKTEQVRREA